MGKSRAGRVLSAVRRPAAGLLLVSSGLVATAAVAPPAAAAQITCTESALIAAINAANSNADESTIELASGCVYTFTSPITSGDFAFWYGPAALPAIASSITIMGNGATIERVADATEPFRLFFVGADPLDADTTGYASPGAGSLTLNDLTLSGGLAQGGRGEMQISGGGGGAGMGGAIFSQGSLTLRGVTITDNTARGGDGGAAVPQPSIIRGGAGGGVGTDGLSGTGGGFGGSSFGGGSGSTSANAAGAGGGGFRAEDDGFDPSGGAGNGGGPNTGTGGAGGFDDSGFGAAGNGSGGGGDGNSGGGGGAGGNLGLGGGVGGGGAGGGGVGGGGGGGGAGGGGGFGAGGGGSYSNESSGGGNGGFGGGGGGGTNAVGGSGGAGQGPGGIGLGGFGGGDGAVHVSHGGGGGGGAGMGGAIFNHQGQLVISNSTLSGNAAVGGIGGAPDDGEIGGEPGADGQGLGGAIFNLNGLVTVDSATVAFNTSDAGGALYNLGYLAQDPGFAYVAQTTLENSILADSIASSDVSSDSPVLVSGDLPNTVSSNVTATGPNVVESSVELAQGTVTGTPLAVDPGLGLLADNGGATFTHALTEDSPAVDTGATVLAADQRGITRPQGTADDIGAFELESALATPIVTTQASGTVPIGGTVSDVATVTGAEGVTPTGTVTFALYGPGDSTCSTSNVTLSGPRPLTGSAGSATASSGDFTPAAPGTYRWTASYSGDANYAPVTTPCNDANESVVVTQAVPTVTTQASGNVVLGGSVSDTATVTGGFNPTGTVIFNLYGPNDATCAGTPVFTSPAKTLVGGAASSGSATPTAVGTYRWTASYSGDGNNAAVATACNDPNESVEVTPANAAPVCTNVRASVSTLKADGKMVLVSLIGATDPDGGSLTVTINSVTQDEPVTSKTDKTFPDAQSASGNTVRLRAEAAAKGNGRVYRIGFTVSDGQLSCSRTAGTAGTTAAKVGVAAKNGQVPFDDGSFSSWNSFTGLLLP